MKQDSGTIGTVQPGKEALRPRIRFRSERIPACLLLENQMQRQTRYKNKTRQTAGSGNLFCLFRRNVSPLSLFFSSARRESIPFQAAVQLSVHRRTFASALSVQNRCGSRFALWHLGYIGRKRTE